MWTNCLKVSASLLLQFEEVRRNASLFPVALAKECFAKGRFPDFIAFGRSNSPYGSREHQSLGKKCWSAAGSALGKDAITN